MNFALDGFGGFVSFSGLPAAGVPAEPGVYVVVRTAKTTPVFLPASPAGWFKGKDPTLNRPLPVTVHPVVVGTACGAPDSAEVVGVAD